MGSKCSELLILLLLLMLMVFLLMLLWPIDWLLLLILLLLWSVDVVVTCPSLWRSPLLCRHHRNQASCTLPQQPWKYKNLNYENKYIIRKCISILYTPSTTLEIFSLCRRHHLVFQHSSLASTYNWLFVCTAINFITIMIIINTWHASWISRSHAFISWRSMVPFPSTSYIRNAQRNFSSAFPVNYHGCFGKLFNYFWTMPEIHKIKLFWNVKYQYLLK